MSENRHIPFRDYERIRIHARKSDSVVKMKAKEASQLGDGQVWPERYLTERTESYEPRCIESLKNEDNITAIKL